MLTIKLQLCVYLLWNGELVFKHQKLLFFLCRVMPKGWCVSKIMGPWGRKAKAKGPFFQECPGLRAYCMVQSPLDQDPPNPPWNHQIPHEKPNCRSWRGKLWHLTEISHSWLWSSTLDEILHFLIQSFPIFTIFHLNFLAILHARLFSFRSLHRVKPWNEGITRI